MYSVAAHGKMMSDGGRIAAYELALQRAIRPGSTVVDIGCGAGILSMLACRLGARQVYAIEPDNVIELARELAHVNGCADRITFIQDFSTHVTLPEAVDVMVSDLRGVLPLFQQHIPAIADARRRFLKPGGTQIPQRDTIWVAPVEDAGLFKKATAGWEKDQHGLDLQSGLRYCVNTWGKERFGSNQLIGEPQQWATIDYTTIEDANVRGRELSWPIARASVGHGLAVWFDAELFDGVKLSNAPGGPELIYGNGFFPWTEAVTLAAGDVVTVQLAAVPGSDDYVWSWNTRVTAAGQAARVREVKANFQQSSLLGVVLSVEALRRQSSEYVPTLNEEGEIERRAASLMDGKNSLEEIARELAKEFPDRFSDWKAALGRVGEMAGKYSR